jgi:cystathionine beta-lyase
VLNFKDKYDKVIIASSANKTFNIAGIRTSYAVIPNDKLREEMKLTFNDCMISNVSTMGDRLYPIILSKEGLEFRKELMDYVKTNYDLLYKPLVELGFNVHKLDSSFQI